jgi:hypothetical protein
MEGKLRDESELISIVDFIDDFVCVNFLLGLKPRWHTKLIIQK